MKHRILALCMSLALLTSCGAPPVSSEQDTAVVVDTQETALEADSENTVMILDTTAGVLVTGDPAEYPNGEVFVCYTDGTYDILIFETDEALAKGLEQLLQDETVTLIQPNYSYEGTSVSATDTLAGQQWALYNDGSFQMVEEENRYPVYENPFETPFAPGKWMMPGNFNRPGGFWGMTYRQMTSNQSVSAVAGIDINAEDAWNIYDGGSRDVVVAMIDTGIDYNHEDLQGILWTNTNEIAGNNKDDDDNGYIDDIYSWNFYNNSNKIYVSGTDDAHGTHGAGTIAAAMNNGVGIAGIADSEHIKIMSLKALGGSNGSGSTASIIKAIQYAEANGASICNLSLGSTTNDRALYQVMASSSMLFVVAAGNDGTNSDRTPTYPASYDLENIISVANLNYNGSLHSSSNYGTASVDLAAPGSYILSTTPEDNYSYMTGTSMAAPMVTGAAAMLYSYHEDISLADVKGILLSTVTQLDTLTDSTRTGGMLNLGAAMAYDTAGLTGESRETPMENGVGSPPEISIQSETRQGETYLVVQVTDMDGDLAITAYSTGIVSAEQFLAGSAGTEFSLENNSTAVFSVRSSGIYTFYASDAAGNEVVQSVSVTLENQLDGESPRGGVGNWMSPPGMNHPGSSSPWPQHVSRPGRIRR